MHWETKHSCDSLYYSIWFIEVVWNWIPNVSEVCLLKANATFWTFKKEEDYFGFSSLDFLMSCSVLFSFHIKQIT